MCGSALFQVVVGKLTEGFLLFLLSHLGPWRRKWFFVGCRLGIFIILIPPVSDTAFCGFLWGRNRPLPADRTVLS
jgi:hypothetical protein